MNRKKRTALWVLLALAAVIGGLCIWQRDNLRALVLSRSMTQEKFTEQISQQQAKTEQAAQEAGVTVRPMTEEEKELLHSGEEDRDALIDRLTQAQKPNQPPEQTEQAPQEQPEQPDPQGKVIRLQRCLFHGKTLAYGYREGVHTQPHRQQEKFSDSHKKSSVPNTGQHRRREETVPACKSLVISG